MLRSVIAFVPGALLALSLACGGSGEVILATTTSLQDSGLLDVLVPAFEEATGYNLKTVAVGSGLALRLGEEGEADVILAHSPEAEEAFMAAGHGVDRRLIMHNDFILVGPEDDPAGIAGLESAPEALARIAAARARFMSRGDESGTHAKELKLWQAAGVSPSGSWYQETGQGMGQTLLIASEKEAYTLSDRGTFLALRRRLGLQLLVEGDQRLLNVYHVIAVNPAEHPGVNAVGARAFADFLTSAAGQEIIRTFGVKEYGQPLFVPDAHLQSAPDDDQPAVPTPSTYQ